MEKKTEDITVLEQKLVSANDVLVNTTLGIGDSSLRAIRHNLSMRKQKELSGMFELVDDCLKQLATIARKECVKRFKN